MKKLIFIWAVLLMSIGSSYATHLRAGYISYLKKSGLTYQITITVYTDTGSEVVLGDGYLDFGDGSELFEVPQTEGSLSPQLGSGVAYATFTIEHTYTQAGTYIINYTEPNRNPNVLNMDNSVNTMFSVESMLLVDSTLPSTHSSPEPLTHPIFFQSRNNNLSFSLAHYDANDYKLRYQLKTPKMSKDQFVEGYQLPNVKLDSISGLLTWQKDDITNAALGEYAFTVEVSQYHQIDGSYELTGYMLYDFQVILSDSDGKININSESEKSIIKVLPQSSETLNYDISSGSELTVEVNSELSEEVVKWELTGTATEKKLKLVITPTNAIDRDNPYVINIKALTQSRVFAKDYNLLLYTSDVNEPNLTVTSTGKGQITDIVIFPQPVSGTVNIEGVLMGSEYKIYAQTGHLLLEGHTYGQIDFSGFNRGVYFLIVGNDKFKIIKK